MSSGVGASRQGAIERASSAFLRLQSAKTASLFQREVSCPLEIGAGELTPQKLLDFITIMQTEEPHLNPVSDFAPAGHVPMALAIENEVGSTHVSFDPLAH